MKSSEEITENPIKGEIYSVERLEEYAEYLGQQLKISDTPKVSYSLLPRMRENGVKLLSSYRALTEAIHKKEAIPPAAEWLTDNFHIVEDQLREIQEDLPPTFYKELPKIALGNLIGYPRIYAIALALVAHTDSQLEPDNIRKFVQAYQKISPLTIGELWALAITLRLVLVENLRRIAVRIVLDHEKRNLANRFADKLIELAGDKVKFEAMVLKLPTPCHPTAEGGCAYTAQIAKRLRDQEPELWPALERLEEHLAKVKSSTENVVNLYHQLQASNQITVANIITSMRLLSSLNWQDFFESISRVDRILEKDPVYKQMDFLTRDCYRHVIENVGKRVGVSETVIAEKAIGLAEEVRADATTDVRKAHVGYYLIGQGVEKLEKQFDYDTGSRALNFVFSHPNHTYFGLIGFLLAGVCAAPLYYSTNHGASFLFIIGIGLLILIPCSELALSITNLILTHAIKPKRLPKLDLSSGIPQSARTMVVIPCMLSSVETIQELIGKIEIHYLGNDDKEIFFALLTDYVDGVAESLAEDEVKLKTALDGISRLNQKYSDKSGERFFLFHRHRQWNPSEQTWMGWERKRGKIHEFNRVLRGDQNTSFAVVTAPPGLLPTIRFVITLDADTQLPRDTARKLVGTILHPLNQPHFDKTLGRVTEGYGVLQPRIGISLESSTRSLFSKIFSGYTGIDPYTTAVSETYQDLFHEGSYVGKGLYDVDAFESALANRVPENAILSHDLFEGLYARTALLTDVELLDDYPQSYQTFFARQHRWTRGDWQIGAWILPFVQSGKKQWVRNQLPLISKWKIFDNLRRSLVAPSTFLWIILSLSVFPGSPNFWISYGLTIIIFPSLAQAVFGAVISRFGNHTFRMAATGVKTKINALQALLYIIFLAHQAYIHLDAITRVIYRKTVSKIKLLEWTSAAQAENQEFKFAMPFWQTIWPTEIILVGGTICFLATYPPNGIMVIFFALPWISYPLVASLISHNLVRKDKPIDADGQLLLRKIARRTWHYFETFVGQDDNWLPPDNYQEFPNPLVAHRTSPTNIGLYILSLLSARDLGFLSTSKFLNLLESTLETLEKLEQHEGHFYNWYDTRTLQTLNPKYVSTVDSGNLAAYFLTVRQACLNIPNCYLFDKNIFKGLSDTVFIIENEIREIGRDSHGLLAEIHSCQRLLSSASSMKFSGAGSSWISLLKGVHDSLENVKNKVSDFGKELTEKNLESVVKWVDACILQTGEIQSDLMTFAPWLTDEFSKCLERSPEKWKTLTESFERSISLSDLPKFYEEAILFIQSSSLSQEYSAFAVALKKGKSSAVNLLKSADTAAHFMDQKFKAMNFNFLLDKTRRVFSIGYSVTDGKMDSGLYDLLGSESRLVSFVAIAKGDVPQEHWFRLGRQLVPTSSGRALVSWTASMFEYLMPLLVLRDYENTLLDETVHTVVSRQVKYGCEHRVPWGVSEAGYNARDLQMNYQYGPFGIPGLGLKRGLSQDLVISPYSTLLAAQVNPEAAIENLKTLINNQLLATFGFYESVDYTKERLPENQKFAIVKSFMAHHQGMSLVAINNVINKNIMQDRFHSDPRVQATRLLLQERVPRGVVPILPKAAELELGREYLTTTNPLVRNYTDPNSSNPHVQLLSNRNYSLMISSAGGGYSKCGDFAVTRWKEDATRDNWGSFIFIRDLSEETIWSASYQPFVQLPESYKVTFREEKVEFHRRDGDISTFTQILVASEDNVEIRHLTLSNHSDKTRILELTSYLEPVLGPPANDLDHMAFSKLFIQTEFLSSKNALLAKSRSQSSHDKENWGMHVVVSDCEILSDVQFETDRAKFIGRGRTLTNSIALSKGESLSNTSGATLDPILSLRVKVRVPPNSKTQVAFNTGFAFSREEALVLADRYHDIHSFDRQSKLAWTKSQVDMRHLNIDSETAYLYQRLAERILYLETTLRPPEHQRAANTNLQSNLWPSGVSGDLPIVVVRINDEKDMGMVRKLLRCHEYLRLKGLVYDFIILNEHEITYFQALQDELLRQIRTTGSQGWLNKPGGVFILRSGVTPEKDIAHILSVARVSLNSDEPLKDQVYRKTIEEKYPVKLSYLTNKKMDKTPEAQDSVSKSDLEFFNGMGGFDKNSGEYIIALRPGQWTPAPWINVIGNSRGFGFQVSESGSGFTWSINSQTNRLTPWSNDPVSDPAGEIIYLRDDETGEVWTPTPLPIRSDEPYTIRHGQGYTTFEHSSHGLQHTLTLFVPKDQTVKISLLTLKNLTNKKHKISITSYTEWVLGSQRQKTASYLICDVDKASGAIFTENPHDNEFATKVTFSDFSCDDRTFTCSRKEFLGRNGNYANPAALKRDGLSRKKGTGQDPCAVLQSAITLAPGEEREISFLLGQCENADSARELTLRFRDLKIVRNALSEVINSWKKFLNCVQVKTPDLAMNLIMNKWLLYQTLSCRYWSRTAFYQSGGAYGFRDQLQDCMAFIYSAPHLTREHILRASERQFKEGDVQHWWHPPTGQGIRTRMSDDLLWLPYVVSFYIDITGDKTILEEKTPFLEAPLLKPEEKDSYTLPKTSSESATIFEHCVRAINHSLSLGQHELPLIGAGDWNDGMNRVGSLGKGESIWMGWFLYKVLADFLPYCGGPEQEANRQKYGSHMKTLKMALEKNGWDGDWYKRAYFDDGTPLGSATNEECRIASIAQSWAVLSGAGDRVRAVRAMEKVSELLIRNDSQLVLLLTPPFDKSPLDPGYIKGYVPGVRENGGQYTHAAVWVMIALAKTGNGNKAFEIFRMLNPILHSKNDAESCKYKIEPYVIAGDVYAGDLHDGRGGWSWYTGSASWYYRGCLESLLGFQLQGNKLRITPSIPNTWESYEISYMYGESKYLVKVNNPKGLSTGNVIFELDGSLLKGSEVALVDDGKNHQITATLSGRPKNSTWRRTSAQELPQKV